MSVNVAQQIKLVQLSHRRSIVNLLDESSSADKQAFSSFIEACTVLGLSRAALAEEFKVTQATIGRWIRGTSVPGPGVRKVVLQRVRALLERDPPDVTCRERSSGDDSFNALDPLVALITGASGTKDNAFKGAVDANMLMTELVSAFAKVLLGLSAFYAKKNSSVNDGPS